MDNRYDPAEIEAIKALKARYFRYFDTKQWEAWRTVFADDLAIKVDMSPPRTGQDALSLPQPQGANAFVGHMQAVLGDVTTVHHGHMPEITLTGPDTAEGVWSMEDVLEYPDGRVMRGYGHYHEQYRKIGGAWRIARLHLTRLRLEYTGGWSASDLELRGAKPGRNTVTR